MTAMPENCGLAAIGEALREERARIVKMLAEPNDLLKRAGDELEAAGVVSNHLEQARAAIAKIIAEEKP